jgi:hypothetical protein
MPLGSCAVPAGSGRKNGIVSRDRKSGSALVSLTVSTLPFALIPEIDFAFPSSTASAPTISCM